MNKKWWKNGDLFYIIGSMTIIATVSKFQLNGAHVESP